MNLKVHFDNRDKFTDYTKKDLFYYRETDTIKKYEFQHLKYGIYVPVETKCLILTGKQINVLLNDYSEIIFLTKPVLDEIVQNDSLSETESLIQSILWKESIRKGENIEAVRFQICFAYSGRDVGVKNVQNWLKKSVESEECLKPYKELIQTTEFKLFGNNYSCWEDYEIFTDHKENKKRRKLLSLQFPEKDPDRKHIILKDCVGIMIEPGIYYFSMPGNRRNCGRVHINYNTHFKEKVAGICYSDDFHPSPTGWLEYLAIGEEHFARLKEIVEMTDYGFYHEFHQVEETDEKSQVLESMELEKLLKKVQEEDESQPEIIIENDAEELVEGIGFRKIELYFSIPLVCKEKSTTYEAAYKLGDKLILVNHNRERKEIDMRLMDTLYVQEKKFLRCGVICPVVHKVIDCKEEKLREILTEEAYELYKAGELL